MALGRKSKKGERVKALPDRYENEGPIDISEGYKKLSRVAFAVWIRLSVASREELHGGRQYVAKLLGYSQRRSNEVLLELERKGFIMFISNGPWQKTAIAITRKPLLKKSYNFTKFSGYLFSHENCENRSKEKNGFRTRKPREFSVKIGIKPYRFIDHSVSYPDHLVSYPDHSVSYPNYSVSYPNSSHTFFSKKSKPINLYVSKKEKR